MPFRSLSIVFGTPTTGRLSSANSLAATPSVSSPPIATSASICSKVFFDPFDAALELVRIRAGGTDDRAALRQDPRDLVVAERLQVPVDHPAPAVQDADRLVAVLPQPPADRSDHRIQTRAIPAACEHPHPHRGAILATAALPARANRQLRMLTARAATSNSVNIEIADSPSMRSFAVGESGIVSVGLNAVEFVNER